MADQQKPSEGSVIAFRQPVYAYGSQGRMYVPGEQYEVSDVTEQALSFKGAWYEVKEPKEETSQPVQEETRTATRKKTTTKSATEEKAIS